MKMTLAMTGDRSLIDRYSMYMP